MEGIDPEFLAALPPDMQAEVLEQQRLDRRRRQLAAQQEAAIAVRFTICVSVSRYSIVAGAVGCFSAITPSIRWHVAVAQEGKPAMQKSIAGAC